MNKDKTLKKALLSALVVVPVLLPGVAEARNYAKCNSTLCPGKKGDSCSVRVSGGTKSGTIAHVHGDYVECEFLAPPVSWVSLEWDQLPSHQTSQGLPVYQFRHSEGSSPIALAESRAVLGSRQDKRLSTAAQCGGYGGMYYQWAPYDDAWSLQPWTEVSYYTVTPNPHAVWGTQTLWWQEDSRAVSYRLRITQNFGDYIERDISGIEGASYEFQGSGSYMFEAWAQLDDGSEIKVAVPHAALSEPFASRGTFGVGFGTPQRPHRTVSWDAGLEDSKYTVRLAKDVRNFGNASCGFSEEPILQYDSEGNAEVSHTLVREEPSGLLLIRPEVLEANYDLDEALEFGHTYFVRIETRRADGFVEDVHECSFEVGDYDGTNEHETVVCDGAPPPIGAAEFNEGSPAVALPGGGLPGPAVSHQRRAR